MKLALKMLNTAPETGRAMIYYQTGIYYGDYKFENGELKLSDGNPWESTVLELHLFDANTEYRAVYSQMENGYMETVIQDASQKADVRIPEECFLLPEYSDQKIGIMNYLCFDEDDLLHLANYRIYTVKGGMEIA